MRNCSDTQSVLSWIYKETEIKIKIDLFLFLCDGFRKTDIGIKLITNAFRGSIQNKRLFSIFSSFIVCSIIYLFDSPNEAYSCLPSEDGLNCLLSLIKGWFHLRSFYSVQTASCSFTCI